MGLLASPTNQPHKRENTMSNVLDLREYQPELAISITKSIILNRITGIKSGLDSLDLSLHTLLRLELMLARIPSDYSLMLPAPSEVKIQSSKYYRAYLGYKKADAINLAVRAFGSFGFDAGFASKWSGENLSTLLLAFKK